MNKKEAQDMVNQLAQLKELLSEEHQTIYNYVDKLQDKFLNIVHPVKKGFVRFRTSNGYVQFKPREEKGK